MQDRYAVTSLNLTLGDWAGTRELLRSCMQEAIAGGAQIVVFPEFALCGVNLKDRFLRAHTFERAQEMLRFCVPYSKSTVIIAGLPVLYNGKAYNVAAVMYGGRVCAYIPKTYPLQYLEEERYFARWPHALICKIGDVDCGMIRRPVEAMPRLRVFVGSLEELKDTEKGDILVQICAKPYYIANYRRSLQQLVQYSANQEITILRSAMHGSDDGVAIYDGASLVVECGKVLALGARFDFGRDAVLTWSDEGLHNCFDPSLWAHVHTESFPHHKSEHEFAELELALCLGLRDYLRRARIERICLALSGGRDSSMCAIIAARMYALEHPELSAEELGEKMAKFLICAYLPSENSSTSTMRAAQALAEALGASFLQVPIGQLCKDVQAGLGESAGIALSWAKPEDDLSLQNLQARMRSTVIWTIANAHNALLLNTGNMSEAAVGYTTMDGDSCGGLDPIGNLPKTLISRWLTWAMVFHRLSCLQLVFAQAPSAELRPPQAKQEDEADLMPYPILDSFIEAFVVQRLSPRECCILCWPKLQEHCKDKAQFTAYLKKFIRMLCFSQWKRNRLASSFKLLAYDLDPKSGLRWPVLQRAFDEDFSALDAWAQGSGD